MSTPPSPAWSAWPAWLALEGLAHLLAPPRCAACDVRVGARSVFCADCARLAEPLPHGGSHATAAYVYGGPITEAITRLKYGRRPDLARPLGDLLWRAMGADADDLRGSVVVPVPLHPTRLAERGYNQAALLASRLAFHLGARCAMRALARTRDTTRQTTLDRSTRASNVLGAFEARAGDTVRGRSVLLVDDVRTTGATLDACIEALATAGASRVAWAVVAQTGGDPAHAVPRQKDNAALAQDGAQNTTQKTPPKGVLLAREVSSKRRREPREGPQG
jgi:ComF family protein